MHGAIAERSQRNSLMKSIKDFEFFAVSLFDYQDKRGQYPFLSLEKRVLTRMALTYAVMQGGLAFFA